MSGKDQRLRSVSRRTLLRAGAGLAGGMLPSALTTPAFAIGIGDKPAIGTWPAGSEGETVILLGAAVPRTGSYAVQGEDELKGWELAVEHINNGVHSFRRSRPRSARASSAKSSPCSLPTVPPSRTRRCRSSRPLSTRTRSY